MCKRFRPHAEQLEDRCVPSLTATTINGSLYLTGKPNGELDIIGTGTPYQFLVTDNSAAVGMGTYTITGNLSLNLVSEKADINIDLMGETLPGNVLISLGTGYSGAPTATNPNEINIYDSTGTGNPVMAPFAPGAGEISGSLTILRGSGAEFINVGAMQANPSAGSTQYPITLDGNLTVAGSPSNASSTGNAMRIGDGTDIFGSVTTTYVSQVNIGSGTSGNFLTTISENVTINDAGSLRFLSAADFGAEIMGNLSVTGTSHDDSFSLQQFTTGGGFVGGNLNVNLGQGTTSGDQITLGADTEVEGNAYLTAGNNLNTSTGDQYSIYGSVDQNLTVVMGNNMNSLTFTANSNPGSPTPFVGGNMLVTAGNGINVIGQTLSNVGFPPPTGEFNGIVNHNLTFILGSGNNGSALDPMIIAALVNGKFNWTSGNGQDFLQLGDSSTPQWITNPPAPSYQFDVNIHFGNKDDTFILDIGTGGMITGAVNGGGRQTANTFTTEPTSIGTDATLTISNFP